MLISSPRHLYRNIQNSVWPNIWAQWLSQVNTHTKPSQCQTHLVAQSCPTLCDPMNCMYPARFFCPWNSPGKNAGVVCHSLLQGIFLTQGLNPGLPRCRQILYSWTTREALFQSTEDHCPQVPKKSKSVPLNRTYKCVHEVSCAWHYRNLM